MYDQALFLRILSDFTRHLLDPHDVEHALTLLADRVTQVLGLAGSGVSLGRGDSLLFVTAVPSGVARLEKTQQQAGSGPCRDAYRTRRTVAVEDLGEHRDRWPEYCKVADEVGVESVASIPMQLRDVTVGTLELYGDGHRSWPEEDLAVATVMADVATVYLVHSSIIQKQADLNSQLQTALDSRIVIEQAKGILANTHRISIDAAFDRMRQHARAHNTALHEIAAAVVGHDLVL